MRKYTILFMEQRLGFKRLTRMSGPAGEASFESPDDDAALAHVTQHLLARVESSVRAELSSMAIVPDARAANGVRVVDDSLQRPHFQELFLRYNAKSGKLDVDYDSTSTGLVGDFYRIA